MMRTRDPRSVNTTTTKRPNASWSRVTKRGSPRLDVGTSQRQVIFEDCHGVSEINAVFGDIRPILGRVPIEPHGGLYAQLCTDCNARCSSCGLPPALAGPPPPAPSQSRSPSRRVRLNAWLGLNHISIHATAGRFRTTWVTHYSGASSETQIGNSDPELVDLHHDDQRFAKHNVQNVAVD